MFVHVALWPCASWQGKLGILRHKIDHTSKRSRKEGAGRARTGTPVAGFPCNRREAAADAPSASPHNLSSPRRRMSNHVHRQNRAGQHSDGSTHCPGPPIHPSACPASRAPGAATTHNMSILARTCLLCAAAHLSSSSCPTSRSYSSFLSARSPLVSLASTCFVVLSSHRPSNRLRSEHRAKWRPVQESVLPLRGICDCACQNEGLVVTEWTSFQAPITFARTCLRVFSATIARLLSFFTDGKSDCLPLGDLL